MCAGDGSDVYLWLSSSRTSGAKPSSIGVGKTDREPALLNDGRLQVTATSNGQGRKKEHRGRQRLGNHCVQLGRVINLVSVDFPWKRGTDWGTGISLALESGNPCSDRQVPFIWSDHWKNEEERLFSTLSWETKPGSVVSGRMPAPGL